MTEGVDYYGLVKTRHKVFCLATLKKLIKDWPGGSYLVMNINPRFPGGIPLLEIGHKCHYRKVLGFIDTEGAESTEPSDSYLSCFPEIYSNVSIRPIFLPHVLYRYFNDCNEI